MIKSVIRVISLLAVAVWYIGSWIRIIKNAKEYNSFSYYLDKRASGYDIVFTITNAVILSVAIPIAIVWAWIP